MSQPVDEAEAEFRQVVNDAAGRLWTLGAVEETLAALHDVLDEAVSQHDSGGGRDDGVPESNRS